MSDYVLNGVVGAVTGAIGGAVSKMSFVFQIGTSGVLGAGSNILEGFYTGELKSNEVAKIIATGFYGAVTSALSFSMALGISKVATRMKYSSIVGNNTSNHHINQALSKAGYGNLKIGKFGLENILKELGEAKSVKAWEYFASAVFDFITGVI